MTYGTLNVLGNFRLLQNLNICACEDWMWCWYTQFIVS